MEGVACVAYHNDGVINDGTTVRILDRDDPSLCRASGAFTGKPDAMAVRAWLERLGWRVVNPASFWRVASGNYYEYDVEKS